MKAIYTLTPKEGMPHFSWHCLTKVWHTLLFACLLTFTQQAAATIRYVKASGTGGGTSWSDASGDLQAMINASSSGDQVWVAGGTYLRTSSNSFTMAEGVKIYGGFAGTETSLGQRDLMVTANASIIQGDGHSINIYNGDNHLTAASLLDGFTLTNNYRGIYNSGSSPTFSNCIISNNNPGSDNGGGLYNTNGGSPTFINCTFKNNSGRNFGGGIYNVQYSTVTLINCSFSNNSTNGFGGGIYNENGTATLTNCTFSNNTAAMYGGGVCNGATAITLTNCTFTGNYAGYYGGGMYSENRGSIVATGCIFKNNSSDYGGGIANDYECTGVITNCLFSGNAGNSGGGGINNRNSYAVTITNCTISGNTGGAGAGIYNDNTYTTPSIHNTIIYNNSSGIDYNSSSANISYSLIQGSTDITNGNISGTTDPLFVNPLTPGLSTGGDYSLQACSPVINKGSNSYFASGQNPDLSAITTDLAANARTYNSTVDMGAYEFAATPGGANLLAISGDVATATISGSATLTATASTCRTVTTLLPTGTSTALTGTVTAKVWIETTQPANYVKRHYQVTPATNAATSTARVTLYFTQGEFDAFNAVNTLLLPTGPTDATHIANLLIEKRPGTSSDGTGVPDSYSGTPVTINPADADIVWNSTVSRWEISFDVTGFSGFFVKTKTSALPLTLLSFTGGQYNGYNKLQWVTADEVNTSSFVLERSADGSSFNAIATIAANGAGNGNYSYKDYFSFTGKIYYRLKMVDTNGSYTYSTIVILINNGSSAVSIYPNPATDVININAGMALLNTRAGLYDANGRLLQNILITAIPQTVNIQALTNGLYLIQFANGSTIKFVKQ